MYSYQQCQLPFHCISVSDLSRVQLQANRNAQEPRYETHNAFTDDYHSDPVKSSKHTKSILFTAIFTSSTSLCTIAGCLDLLSLILHTFCFLGNRRSAKQCSASFYIPPTAIMQLTNRLVSWVYDHFICSYLMKKSFLNLSQNTIFCSSSSAQLFPPFKCAKRKR